MEIRHIHTQYRSISIATPVTLLPALEQSVFSCLLEPGGKKLPRHYQIYPENNRFSLYRQKRKTHRNRSVNKIIYALEWQIVEDLIKAHKKVLQFHAAALEYNQHGYLFVGLPGSGKTSLSIFLQRHGWQLLSDEFGLVDPASRQMIAMPRNIIIKPHLSTLLEVPQNGRGIRIRSDNPKQAESFFVPADTFGIVSLQNRTVLQKLILLKADPEREYTLEKTSQVRAFEFLFDHLFTHRLENAQEFDTLVNVLRNCSTAILTLRNPLTLPEQAATQLVTELRNL